MPSSELNETAAIAECLRGQASGFDVIHATYAGRVMSYLLRSGFLQHDAEDLCQEVFVRIVKSLKTFDPSRGRFQTWVATIAKNVARKQWRRKAGRYLDFDPDLAEQVLTDEVDTAEVAEQAEEIAAVDDCISRLPADMQRLIHFRYVESRTTRGIAGASDSPEATVRLHLTKARELLRECLESKGIDA